MLFHSSQEISGSLHHILFYWMERAPRKLSQELNFPTVCSRFEIFWNFWFNEKCPKTLAYNKSISHCLLFAQSCQLVISAFLKKIVLFLSKFWSLCYRLKFAKTTDVHFYNTALKVLLLTHMQCFKHAAWSDQVEYAYIFGIEVLCGRII